MAEETQTSPTTRTHGWYILDAGGIPQPVPDGLTWSRWESAHENERLLCQEDVCLPDGRVYWVSTVFLGLDHGCWGPDDSPPVLWETMVFQRQTATSQLTTHRPQHDQQGQPVYREWTGARGGLYRLPVLEEVPLAVGEVSYDDLYCDRYASRDEALAGHQKAVQWVLDGLVEEEDA